MLFVTYTDGFFISSLVHKILNGYCSHLCALAGFSHILLEHCCTIAINAMHLNCDTFPLVPYVKADPAYNL